MKDIAIYGAGGLGREVYHLIDWINREGGDWNVIGFFDDGIEKGTNTPYGSILGGMNDLNQWPSALNVVFAIGSPRTLKFLTSKVDNPNIAFPNLVAPDVVSYGPIEEKLGVGNIITAMCILSCNVHLGNFNLLNGSVSVGHDAHLGDCNVAMPGVKLSGELKVGNGNLFGANSFVHQQTKIGNDVTLAPCSSLLRKPKDGNTYIGNPATIMRI